MRLELMMGIRYLKAKRKFSFVSVVTILCVVGILTGVMVMITVLSVLNGFQTITKERLLGMVSHIDISGHTQYGFSGYDYVKGVAKENEEVISATPYIVLPSILRTGGGAYLTSVRAFQEDVFIEDDEVIKYFNFTEGDYSNFGIEDSVFIGKDMARNYSIELNDEIELITASTDISEGVQPSTGKFIVRGIYQTGYYEYDAQFLIMPLTGAQNLGNMENKASGVAIKINSYLEAKEVAKEIDESLDGFYFVTPWMVIYRNFFAALQNEKIVLSIIVFFIILIASLNIATTQIIFVKDKRRDIAILKTLGLKPFNIAEVFFLEGTIIGFFGTVFGVISGLILSMYINEALEVVRMLIQFGLNVIFFVPNIIKPSIIIPIVPELFPPDIYNLTGLPSIIDTNQVIWIAVISFFLSILFAIVPAYIATKYKPAVVLRYE